MRNSFGKFAQELRASRGITQTAFAGKIEQSLSRISSFEHGRLTVSPEVVGEYIRVLDLKGHDAHELRKRAEFANSRKIAQNKGFVHDDLHALLAKFGSKISPRGIARIKSILADELGPNALALEFSSNKSVRVRKIGTKRSARSKLDAEMFVRISLEAEAVRIKYSDINRPVNMDAYLQTYCAEHEMLDVDIVDELPPYADGAFACIVGAELGHVILVEENRFKGAGKGALFQRHVLAHELGHHILHAASIETSDNGYLPPQELSKLTVSEMLSEPDANLRIEQVVDTIEEVEAECFATMFLVPWRNFLKGTSTHYLYRDFGEQRLEVERYAKYFKNPRVIYEFRNQLFKKGITDFPVQAFQD